MKPAQRILVLFLAVNLAVIAAAVILGLSKTGNPSRYFGEGRFTTAVSCAQLLLVAFFAFRIFAARRALSAKLFAGPALWLFVAAGFVFLAADDAFKIHETLGRLLRGAVPSGGGPMDDLVLVAYGLAGIAMLWLYRRELRPMRVMLPPLAIGFIFAAAAILSDALGDKPGLLLRFVGDLVRAKKLQGWADVGDGGFTLLAEGLFASAFYLGWRTASAPSATGSQQSP
jgi:hypothetical protein